MALLLGIFSFLISGCAVHRINLVENRTVQIEKNDSKNVTIKWVSIYEDKKNGIVSVSGEVKRKSSSMSGTSGHVDVSLWDDTGRLVEKASVYHVPRIIRRRGARNAYFSLKLMNPVASGSIVKVAFHPKKYDNRFDCGHNAALLQSEKEKA